MPSSSELLNELQDSQFFTTEFPKRPQRTLREVAESTKNGLRGKSDGMIPYDRSFDRPVSIIRQLGEAKYELAIPTLAQIWWNSPVVPARTAAGHALFKIGTPAALEVLVSSIEDADRFSTYMAVQAIFVRNPMRAFDWFSRYFEIASLSQPGGEAIPKTVLCTFCPSSYSGKEGWKWNQLEAPRWFREDQRWIDLCARLRHDKYVGDVARRALRFADKGLVSRSISHHVGSKVIPQTRPVGDLVSRYRAGEFLEVWHQLRSFKAIDGDLRAEALEVARETMKRAAHNVDLLVSRFEAKGWVSLTTLRTLPDRSAEPNIRRIEEMTKGPVPPSILAFWEIIGGVDLTWDYTQTEPTPRLHPKVDLNEYAVDPLCIHPAQIIDYLFEEWEEAAKGVDPELLDPFSLDLAPDYLHKANISGGAPYAIELPHFGADPVFANEIHELPFVDYLRHCLKCGGFGMLERLAGKPGVEEMVVELTKGFEPF